VSWRNDQRSQHTRVNVLVVHDYSDLGRLLMAGLKESPVSIRSLVIRDPGSVDSQALEEWIASDTDLIVNAFWHIDPELAESDSEDTHQWTFSVPVALAEHARAHEMAMFQLSSCYVFDGRKQSAYITSNPGNPFSQLGNWQWECEQAIRTLLPRHLILRTGWSLERFIAKIAASVKFGGNVELSSRHRGQPVAVRDLARVLQAIIKQIDCGAEVWGTYQYAGSEEVSHYDLGLAIVQVLPERKSAHIVDKVPDWAKLEPTNTTLGCTKIRNTFGIKQRPWRSSIKEDVLQLESEGQRKQPEQETPAVSSTPQAFGH
jgi:dTDP-4-dehydrorhamnose reductase